MTNTVRIETGDTEPIEVLAVDASGDPLAGLTDVFIHIRRRSDNFFFDWNDDTFKTIGSVVTRDQVLSEIDATNAAGQYELASAGHPNGFDTSAITNATADDTYAVTPLQSPGTNATLPPPGEIKEGQWVDKSAQSEKIDSAATVGPGAVVTGSLFDRMANKDSNKTYNQSTDSLEAIKDRIG